MSAINVPSPAASLSHTVIPISALTQRSALLKEHSISGGLRRSRRLLCRLIA